MHKIEASVLKEKYLQYWALGICWTAKSIFAIRIAVFSLRLGAMKGSSRNAYIFRVFVLLAMFVTMALVIRGLLVPEGFGEIGFYRPQAPDEEASRSPVHQGKEVCARCHEKQFTMHENDVHRSVECEVCHGNGAAHVDARSKSLPKEVGYIFKELEQANCLKCHQRILGRPKLFPTISVEEHYSLVGVKVASVVCQECHDPHRPLFLDKSVQEARLHPLIHPCSDCHEEKGIETKKIPANHEMVFECRYCHKPIATDHANRKHSFLRCTGCHQVHKETEFASRIYKNSSNEFCLMCHLKKPFKADAKIPMLESYDSHLDDVASSDADRGKRCVDCHLNEVIHDIKTLPKVSSEEVER